MPEPVPSCLACLIIELDPGQEDRWRGYHDQACRREAAAVPRGAGQ